MTFRLMPFAKIPKSVGNPWGNTSHNQLTKITNSGRKINLGDKNPGVTTPTGMAKRAFLKNAKSQTGGMPQKDLGQQALPALKWTSILAKGQCC